MAIRNESGKLIKNKFSEKLDGKDIQIEANRLKIILTDHWPFMSSLIINISGLVMGAISFIVTCIGCTEISHFWKVLVLILLGLYVFAMGVYLFSILRDNKLHPKASIEDILEEIWMYDKLHKK